LIAAASNRESFAGSGLSGSIPAPAPTSRQELEIVVEVEAPSFYYLGAEGHIDRVESRGIKRSIYAPNLTRQVLTHLTTHPNAQNLFLLGVKYEVREDGTGGDIQAGISESGHIGESPIMNGFRGITEELHMRLARGFSLERFGRSRNHTHYYAEIRSEHDYSLVPIDQIRPDTSQDDKGKASVYLFGTLDALEPIIRGYQPPAGLLDHDAIDKLCAIPFSELRRF